MNTDTQRWRKFSRQYVGARLFIRNGHVVDRKTGTTRRIGKIIGRQNGTFVIGLEHGVSEWPYVLRHGQMVW